MGLHNLITGGGKVVIVGGFNKSWEGYRKYSQLEFWTGDNSAEVAKHIHNHNDTLPSNTKGVIISRFISHSELTKVMADARKKNITIFPNKSDGEISKLLDEITSEIKLPKKIKVIAPRGVIKQLVAQHDDPKLGIKESAKVLFDIAMDKKIPTTINSLTQAVGKHRREKGIGAIPASIHRLKEDSVTTLIRVFDDAIAGLQLCREQISKMSSENEELRKYKIKIQKRLNSLITGDEELPNQE